MLSKVTETIHYFNNLFLIKLS